MSWYLKREKQWKSDPTIKIMLAKSDCSKSDILLPGPKLCALSGPFLCPMFRAWKHAGVFPVCNWKNNTNQEGTSHSPCYSGFVFSYAGHSTIPLVIPTRATSGRAFDLLFAKAWDLVLLFQGLNAACRAGLEAHLSLDLAQQCPTLHYGWQDAAFSPLTGQGQNRHIPNLE